MTVREKKGISPLKSLSKLPEGYYMMLDTRPLDFELYKIIYKFNGVYYVPVTQGQVERHQMIGGER